MKLKEKSPTSNSLRKKTLIQKFLLSKQTNLYKLGSFGVKQFHGRSSLYGRITVRHKGGGEKRRHRITHSTYFKHHSIVVFVSYTPYNSCFLQLNFNFLNSCFFNTYCTDQIRPGSLFSSIDLNLVLGNQLQLKNIPVGSIIYNLKINSKSSFYIRSAGTYGQLLQADFLRCKIRLPSKDIISIPNELYATLGVSSNKVQYKTVKGSAGLNRRLSIRPSVRGIAMNPVDHPHGGRTNGGCPSVSPWGLPSKCGFYLKKRKPSIYV